MQTLDIQDALYSGQNTLRIFGEIAHEDHQGNNGLLEQLQTTLDINKLLNIFAMEASKIVNFSNLYFKKGDIGASIRGGKKAEIERHFDLKIDNEYIGTLTYIVNSPISLPNFHKLALLHKNLLFPLRNAVKYKKAMSLAMQDGLTSLGNRRYFDEQLKRAMHHANRKKQLVGLIMCDLDKFKSINDQFGHKVGDDVLVQFAIALQASVRDSDSLFRFGGDEFAILVEDANEKSLVRIEERVRRKIIDNALLSKYQVSCSLGHTCMTRIDNEQSLFERADKMLYQNKIAESPLLSIV